jgi:hypothetical protein
VTVVGWRCMPVGAGGGVEADVGVDVEVFWCSVVLAE